MVQPLSLCAGIMGVYQHWTAGSLHCVRVCVACVVYVCGMCNCQYRRVCMNTAGFSSLSSVVLHLYLLRGSHSVSRSSVWLGCLPISFRDPCISALPQTGLIDIGHHSWLSVGSVGLLAFLAGKHFTFMPSF